MNYVIIGNSAAAIGTIEGIRQVDQEGGITVIADEKYHTYSRPLISYLIADKTDEQRMKYRPDDFYQKMRTQVLLGTKVTGLRPDKHTVILEDGRSIAYDKLMVATGSRPFVPEMKGLRSVPQQFTFMTLDDAKKLAGALSPDKRVLIIGAGLIGLKCAEGIYGKVRDITVVDLERRILASILDETGSQMVRKHLESKGIRFILGTSTQEFQGTCALLKNGEKLDFDLLVLAVGVRPNTQLIEQAGGEVGRGIVTDASGRTSLSDIYSAGDCTESYDISSGSRRILALLPNAYMQGECAGKTMAGEQMEFHKAIPMNAIGFFGLHMITAGCYEGVEYMEQTGGNYKRLFCKENRLKGYIIIGNVKRAGIYTSLIREQTPLDTIDFELVRQRPQLMAFSLAQREEKLGG